MIHEVTALIRSHLGHATYGVNARLAAMPRTSGDDSPPAVDDFADEFTDDWLTQGKEPPAVPALIVVVRQAADVNVASGRSTVDLGVGSLWVGITYAARDTVGALSRRDAAVTLRAVQSSLAAMVGRKPADRTLRGITVATIDRMQEVPLAPGTGRGGLVGMVVAHVEAVDAIP